MRNGGEDMTEFLGRMYSWFAFVPKITLTNLLEILIISFLIYEILIWVQNTRAWSLLKGGLVIIVFYLAATFLHLTTITWIINHMGQLALIALIIIFRKQLIISPMVNFLANLFLTDSNK